MIELINFERSKRPTKKYVAVFRIDGKRKKTIHFGQKNAEDFTIHKNINRMRAYKRRHAYDRYDEPLTAGALSWWVLWNKPDLNQSLNNYLRVFNISDKRNK